MTGMTLLVYGNQIIARIRCSKKLSIYEAFRMYGIDTDAEKDCRAGLLHGLPGFFVTEYGGYDFNGYGYSTYLVTA